MPTIHLPQFITPISPAILDLQRRNQVDRLLMFLNRFDDNRRIESITTIPDNQGYLREIAMEMASGERYQRQMNHTMMNRLEVFGYVTLSFNEPLFRENQEAEDLIEKSLVLLEALFVHDEHRFDCGVEGMHLNFRPLSNLDPRVAVEFIRRIYDWHLDESSSEGIHWIHCREQIPNYRYKEKNQDQEGLEAFMDKLNALLAEDDDPVLPPEDQLPKAMPTG